MRNNSAVPNAIYEARKMVQPIPQQYEEFRKRKNLSQLLKCFDKMFVVWPDRPGFARPIRLEPDTWP